MRMARFTQPALEMCCVNSYPFDAGSLNLIIRNPLKFRWTRSKVCAAIIKNLSPFGSISLPYSRLIELLGWQRPYIMHTYAR